MRTVIPKDLVISNKWPQMVVTGKPVTVEQAKDIIFRTDTSLTRFSKYGWGNNHRWGEWAQKTLGFDLLREPESDRMDWEIIQEIKNKLGMIETEYVSNTWAASCFIGGPHGWCHPDGKIEFTDNIGKWPSLEAVIEDWEKLQDAFPYIDLAVTLMDKEDCEEDKKPVVSFLVKDGKITFTTDHDNIHQEFDTADKMEDFITRFSSPNREQGLPDSWIIELAKKTKPVIEAELKK